jgi:hypothetical protein
MCAMTAKPGLARRLRWRSEFIIRPVHHVHITTTLPRWRSNRQCASPLSVIDDRQVPPPKGNAMSQTYSQRITSVEQTLADLKVEPRKGMSLADVAVKILAALDRVKENVR